MVAVAASLVGVASPRFVQVVVSDLPLNEAYEVRGTWAGGVWDVRAGQGISVASQLVLNDAASPVNVPVTYQVTVNGYVAAESDPLVVDFEGDYVLQSLDGHSSAFFRWLDNGLPVEPALRASAFTIPGRSTPVVMYDVASGRSGELEVVTGGEQTRALRRLVEAGGPLLLRTNGSIRDLDAVQYVHITRAPSRMTGAGIQTTNDRLWSLAYTVISDPEPLTLVASSTWDHFDAAMAGLTWADFDAMWSGGTWAQFDVHDWASEAEA